MPVIFVHGVNNREESRGFQAGRLATGRFLQQCLGGAKIGGKTMPATFEPLFPYWGGLATKFYWDMRSLPSGAIDALGGGVEPGLRPFVALLRDVSRDPSNDAREPLLAVARRSFSLSIDALGDTLLIDSFGRSPAEVAEFIVAAQTYAREFAPPNAPPWLAGLTTDAQFIGRLLTELRSSAPAQVNALGVSDAIGNALGAASAKLKQVVGSAKDTILDRVGDLASTRALAWSRESLNATLGRFFGDVFIYMDRRGKAGAPGPIPTLLLDVWRKAVAAAPNEPTVIVGHSLGGVITYDLLSHFEPAFHVDLFISVGSQVSHFEEMKLFMASDKGIPNGDLSRRVAKRANIDRWINVFDEVDIFSYACEPIFDGVDDFHYDTGTYVIKAHGAYFTQGRFYQRLRARIEGK